MPSVNNFLHEHYFHSYLIGEIAIGHHALQHLMQILRVLQWILTQCDPKHKIWDLSCKNLEKNSVKSRPIDAGCCKSECSPTKQ